MIIKLVGVEGCNVCKSLEKKVYKAMKELNINGQVEKISDIKEIVKHGVFAIPTIEINGEIKAKGRSPRKKEIIKWMVEMKK